MYLQAARVFLLWQPSPDHSLFTVFLQGTSPKSILHLNASNYHSAGQRANRAVNTCQPVLTVVLSSTYLKLAYHKVNTLLLLDVIHINPKMCYIFSVILIHFDTTYINKLGMCVTRINTHTNHCGHFYLLLVHTNYKQALYHFKDNLIILYFYQFTNTTTKFFTSLHSSCSTISSWNEYSKNVSFKNGRAREPWLISSLSPSHYTMAAVRTFDFAKW